MAFHLRNPFHKQPVRCDLCSIREPEIEYLLEVVAAQKARYSELATVLERERRASDVPQREGEIYLVPQGPNTHWWSRKVEDRVRWENSRPRDCEG